MPENKKSAGGVAAPSAENKKNISTFIIAQAKEKIKVSNANKLGKYEKVVYKRVAEALCLFCEKSEEFSRAVIDCDKSYDECLKSICKGLGNGISDLDMFNKAVQFYFPGAVVEFRMLIHMSEYELDEPEPLPTPRTVEPQKENISISLDSLLDW